MLLEGSCHCRAVRFSVDAVQPYPFNLCYCSICRKTAGGGGYAINLGADNATLEVTGREHVSIYHARLGRSGADDKGSDPSGETRSGEVETSPGERHFCSRCGSALWVWDPRWPELVHPFASAIDTELPAAPERTHLMLGSKPAWVPLLLAPKDQTFDEYPDESLATWHERLGLTS